MIDKKILIMVGIVLLAGGLVYASGIIFSTGKPDVSGGSLQKCLVGHWMLDGDSYNSNTNKLTDKTPYGNSGVNHEATLTTDRMGNDNKAMLFDGSSSFINGDGPIDIENKSFTMAAWIWEDADTPNNWVGPFLIGSSYVNGRLLAANRFLTRNSTGTIYQLSIAAPVRQWNHIVVTNNNDTNTLITYLNGNQVDTKIYVGDLESTNKKFAIGSRVQIGGSTIFNGSISDVRIYNRALTADEINTLYHSYKPKAASGSLQKGLVLDMPLTSTYTKDETVGSEIMTDRTPYSNDGQNYGATVGSDSTIFDGGNDYIDAPDQDILDLTDNLTISAWINPNPCDNLAVVYKFGGGYSGYRFGATTTSMSFGFGNSTGGYEGFTKAVSISDWAHVAVVKNDISIKFFFDGGEVYSGNSMDNLIQTNNINLRIGNNPWNNGWFNGSISDIKIYNRALNAEEIKLLYDKGR